MDPSSNIDSKIGADAINPKPPSAGNLSSKEANSNPLLKDSKRVIKKMIVMDTSRLKGLGIESTIKNAMSKLGKGKSIKVEPPTFTPTNAQPTHTSPKVPETIIKTECERNSVTVKPAVTVIKQIYRPGVPFPATSNSTTDPVPIQPKSNNDKPVLIHPVIHLPRQSNAASANTVSFQSGKVMSPPISVIKTAAQSTSVPSTSSIDVSPNTVPSVRGHVQSNCNAKVVPSQTNSPVIKVESTTPSAASTASDGKKIKVLSNVSLVDGKSKLLEIDKLSSKNLKFTNVIKGTDKSPPKATIHSSSNSAGKPELLSHSNAVPVKVPIDRTTKFTHVIKGAEERQPRTAASAPITVNAPVFAQSSAAKFFPTGGSHVVKGAEERPPRTTASAPITVKVPVFPQSSTAKPLPTGVKLTASVNLRPPRADDEMHIRTTRLIFHADKQHLKPTITSAMPTKTEEEKFASKNLKTSSSADGMNKAIPPKILNFSNVSCGGAAKTTFLNYSVRPSYPTSKPIRTEVNTTPKNVIFTNTPRPTVQITNAARKSTMPLYPPPSTPTKTEFVEIKPHNFNQPNCKSSKESPLYNVPKPPISKVAKPVTSTSSTSAATEVATKQLVTTDENIEIRKPCTQKYLIKSTVSTVSTEMTVSDNEARYRRFHEAVWSTNNPRTYARHNIKRLLSDKIIKKSRSPEVTIDQHGPTSEIFNPERMDQMNDQDVTSTVACDSKSESTKSEGSTEAQKDKFVLLTTEPLQSNPITSVPKPVDDNIGALDNEPMDVNVESGKDTPVPMETASHSNQSQVNDSVKSSAPPVNMDLVHISENNFCGFSVEEVNAGHLLISQIKSILSKNRRDKTIWVSANVSSETEKKMDQDSKHWSLNPEAGLLEEKIDKDAKMTQKHVQPSTETELCQPNVVKEPILASMKLLTTQTSNETELELGLSPSKTPVIEDADDEISDIDLIHRSKPKCTGSTMNRRAILKSIELHRKSVLPATTDDDESEMSLSVRPPRPKLRRSRQKQTLEQLKVQQHAHVSLLKRFVQTDSDYDNLNEEVLMSFMDSVDRRIEVLENQVKDCFKSKICVDDLNVEAISEQSVTSSVDIMKELDEPVKSSESVTKPELVNPSKDSSNAHSELDSAATGDAERPKPIMPSNFETTDSEQRQGQLRVHQVTIQKDTFLVTEYDNQCDKINHLPLKVKLEKHSSPPKPSEKDPVRKVAKPIIRKKRKRKSLVEMLAKHVDKETLKSVIIEHAKQKCDLSSSPDSDSDNDSDRGDVVSKIFRTVCTIDLCDDDDETLHEDVLQYLRETQEAEMDIEQDAMPVTPSASVESKITDEVTEPIESPKSSCVKQRKRKIEPRMLETLTKKTDTATTTVIDTPVESDTENAHICETQDPPTEKVAVVPPMEHADKPVANSCNEKPSHLSLESSIVSLSTEARGADTTSNEMETESNSPTSFDDDTHIEPIDSVADFEASVSSCFDSLKDVAGNDKCIPEIFESDDNCASKLVDKNNLREVEITPPSDDESKLEESTPTATATKNTEDVPTVTVPIDLPMKDLEQPVDVNVSTAPTDTKIDNSTVTKSPKRLVIKLRPFEEISCRPKPKNIDNEPAVAAKPSFGESLAKVDSEIGKKSTSKRKAPKSKVDGKTDTKKSDKSIDSNLNSGPEVSPKAVHKTSKEKAQLSSVVVTDDSTAGSLKIKIKIEKNSGEPDKSTPSIDAVNGVTKPTRSRKRKSAALDDPVDVAITTTPTETTRKRPIFDYFESPEILTTKRARRSKSYVDSDAQIESVPTPPPSNTRTSKRKSKTSTQSDPPNVEDIVDEAQDQQDAPTTEPITMSEPVTEPIAQPTLPVALTLPKTGRGIRPPVLPPLNATDRYVCGNCKEEVVGKDWTKHMKTHYGLAWRVDVDPPIDMDNIHTMSSKVLNFIKKANIKILKCPKCEVEKKSALGYLSHLEVCGLTPEEVKSKLVKCEHCPSMIRNCSMKIHLTFCSGLKRLLQQEIEPTKEDGSAAEESYNEMGRAVRRSAQKAMSSFKDIGKAPETKLEDYVERVEKASGRQYRKWRQLLKDGISIECVRNECDFTADDLMSMVNHFNSCVLIDGETFYCSRCEHGPDIRTVIEEHIKASHSLGVIESIEDKVFSDSDDDAEMGEESSESEGDSGDEEISENPGDESDFDDEDDDGWNSKGYKKRRQRDWQHNEVMLNSCLDRKVLSDYANLLKSYSGGSYYHPTLEWTQDFRDLHFSCKTLFPTATPTTFSVLSSALADLYLPRVQESNKFLVKDVRKYRKDFGSTEICKTDDWKSLKRFEATIDSDSMVLFTGGPILSMAWIPVPDDHLSQLLAVCCRRDANDDILMNNTKAVKCLIQIWNFHKLKNGQLRQAQTPNLLYSVAYDHGPIIQMEFCPSGGFTEDRLGLLAVSSFDGHVDILALPKNFTCENSQIENLVFTIEPSLTLCCERDEPFGVLMTKLVWSQSKGHMKLAGGFANGLVAIWNLKNLETPHACSKVNGIPTLLPTELFFAANKAIKRKLKLLPSNVEHHFHSPYSVLEFHHDENNEARWLIAGSHDRKVKFFDTHNVHLEISTTTAHSRITAGCWPIHWTSFLLGIDNAYSLKVSGIIVKQPLDIGCRTSTYYSCIGSTCDISFNNWLNSYVFVTSYGDIHVGYVRQMISGFCETRRQRSILGYTDCVDITGSKCQGEDGGESVKDEVATSDEQQPSTSSACLIEPEMEGSYPSTDGIVFCDFRYPLPAVTSPSYEKIGAPPMSTYNMVKVNRIVFNPNVSAYKLYALGYESGFVRIVQLLPR